MSEHALTDDEALEAKLCTELDAFVRDMREKLVKNRHKTGWDAMHPTAILERLCEELAELMGTCTPNQAEDRLTTDAKTNRVLDTQREIMLCAIEHVHCAAVLLGRFRKGTPKERVVDARTAGEAADVANFCMFLSHGLRHLDWKGQRR